MIVNQFLHVILILREEFNDFFGIFNPLSYKKTGKKNKCFNYFVSVTVNHKLEYRLYFFLKLGILPEMTSAGFDRSTIFFSYA